MSHWRNISDMNEVLLVKTLSGATSAYMMRMMMRMLVNLYAKLFLRQLQKYMQEYMTKLENLFKKKKKKKSVQVIVVILHIGVQIKKIWTNLNWN